MKHTFFCIDAHTCGNPVRLVAGGGPFLEGADMGEKRLHFLREYDWIRTGLMYEPRGHAMMSGSILYPPHDPANDVAVLFIETSGCLPMCGHGTIGTITIGIEEGLIQPKVPGQVRMEAPAGLVEVRYEQQGGKVKRVELTNVWSFLVETDVPVDCPGLGPIRCDVAYGGNFYAIVDVQTNFPGLEHFTAAQLVAWGREIRAGINRIRDFVHPQDARIRGCSHVLFAGAVLDPASTARNAVFYGEGAIDRSPCGTGTSARMAQWHAQGRLAPDIPFVHESIIGTTFTGRVRETGWVGPFPAIRPTISGWARVYGYNTITLDREDDPFAFGFQVV